ncbi:MAG: site-2 protease family protein, partial [Clostridia bacterium]|nr:site-2 protease family protein [Clostridia bacterium]
MIVLYILLAVVVLMLMVLIHELGHYLVGKKLGFKITEFSIGFGKVLWQKIGKSGEKISLRVFPLGGFCSFYGEDGTEDEKSEVKKDDPDFFTNKHPFKRILVFLAGVTFNFISAIIFSFILLVAFGYGNIYVVTDVNPYFKQGYTDPETGLNLIENRDKILKIDGNEISYIWGNTIEKMVTLDEGKTYTLTIQKNETNEIKEVTVLIQENISATYNEETGEHVINLDEEGNPIQTTGIGFSIGMSSQPISFIDALSQCVSFTIGLVWLVLKTL